MESNGASDSCFESFLGAANFFHTHIPNYASWASSLYECTVTGFNFSRTTWKKDYIAIFEAFKAAITSSVTLHFPDYSLPWIIRSDSSDHAIGAALYQEYTDTSSNVTHQPISFASHKYSGAAVNWNTFKQEAHALHYAVMTFSYYLRGKEFIVETDHRNLVWIEASQVPIVIRWRILLQSFNFRIRHIKGTDNTVADWLSRMYTAHPLIPCSASSIKYPVYKTCLIRCTATDHYITAPKRHISPYVNATLDMASHSVSYRIWLPNAPSARKIACHSTLFPLPPSTKPSYTTNVQLAWTMSP